MRLSDGLKAKRSELLDRMEALSAKAADAARLFNTDEERAWDAAQRELNGIDTQLERQLASEALQRGGGQSPQHRIIDGEGQQHTILRSTDKLADRHGTASRELLAEGSLGAAVKGIVTGNWGGRTVLQRALAEGALASGGYAVPTPLAARWLDMVRAQSALIAAGVGTMPMDSATLRVAGLATDVVPSSKKENTAFPDSDPTFRAVDMRAHTIGVVVTSSMELIADSPNAEAMIEASIIGALAQALDAQGLAGDGSQVGDLDNMLGLLGIPGINEIAAVGTPDSYDEWLDGMALIDAANFTANAVIDHPNTSNFLRKLVTGIATDKTKLAQPIDYAELTKFKTTNMPSGKSVIGEFSRAVFGLREGVTIEATRVGGEALSKGQVLIRGYMRADFAALYVKAFTRLIGITYV